MTRNALQTPNPGDIFASSSVRRRFHGTNDVQFDGNTVEWVRFEETRNMDGVFGEMKTRLRSVKRTDWDSWCRRDDVHVEYTHENDE